MTLAFVRGGTPKSPKSNTMVELAADLPCVLDTRDSEMMDTDFATMAFDVLHPACEADLDDVVNLFQFLVDEDIHIVGSNGNVHRSCQVLKLVRMVANGDIDKSSNLNFFTRSLGLRELMVTLNNNR